MEVDPVGGVVDVYKRQVTYFADMYYAMRAGLQEKLGLTEEAYAALVESRLETAEIQYKDMKVSPEDIA